LELTHWGEMGSVVNGCRIREEWAQTSRVEHMQ
jgi:hypothetical protein